MMITEEEVWPSQETFGKIIVILRIIPPLVKFPHSSTFEVIRRLVVNLFGKTKHYTLDGKAQGLS